jgi:two-component system, NtrC family, nitrogen regulation sensor histidine kinase NtrY
MRKRRYQAWVLLDAWIVVAPALIALGVVYVLKPLSVVRLALLVAGALLLSFALAVRARNRAVYPLHTAANLLAALRVGDTSQRAATADPDDSFGNILWEVNALADSLRTQRLKLQEADALLAKVVATTDIALFAFDAQGFLKLVNPAGARLLGRAASDLLGRSAEALQLSGFDDAPQIAVRDFPGGSRRFEFRRHTFRDGGLEHQLVSVSDLSRALREEERTAWQRLIRVLGHEVNNSLTPIKSIAGTLSDLTGRQSPPSDWREDLANGLTLISQRADALSRFLIGYTTLARLPPPRKRDTNLAELLARTAKLEQRLPVKLELPGELRGNIDPDQIEQAVINLLRNAADAALPSSGKVILSLTLEPSLTAGTEYAVICIEDDGPGLAASDNLFVPFFTTKPEGCGIGLLVSRQIAEGHGGTVTLENRAGASGCVATLRLTIGS